MRGDEDGARPRSVLVEPTGRCDELDTVVDEEHPHCRHAGKNAARLLPGKPASWGFAVDLPVAGRSCGPRVLGCLARGPRPGGLSCWAWPRPERMPTLSARRTTGCVSSWPTT